LWQLVNETYEPADATILKSADIGVTVQGYDANILVADDIGDTVQGYDVNTAKYDAETANFTGNLQVGGSNVVPVSRTIASIDLIDNITAEELTAAINEATQSLKGLLSATDKERLDALYALTQEATGQEALIDTLNEVLAVFANYPEELNLIQELNSKLEEVQAEGTPLTITNKAVNITRSDLGAGTGDADVFYFTTTIVGSDGSSNWVEETTGDWDGAFIATKTVSGILATDKPLIDIDLSSLTFATYEDVQTDYGLIFRVEASDTDEIKFYASEEPAKDLAIQIKVVR
jgi:hypothetical protein